MIIFDQQERTLSGKFARKPHIVYQPNDFPPDSLYWKIEATQAGRKLGELIGDDNSHIWCEMKWPGDAVEALTFKDIAMEFRAAKELGKEVLLDMLECTCREDTAVACPPCRAAARIRARSAVDDIAIE